MSNVLPDNPDEARDFSAEIAHRRGKLFLVESGNGLDKPESAPAKDKMQPSAEEKAAVHRQIEEARRRLKETAPEGTLTAKERGARRAESQAHDEAMRRMPPPSARS